MLFRQVSAGREGEIGEEVVMVYGVLTGYVWAERGHLNEGACCHLRL